MLPTIDSPYAEAPPPPPPQVLLLSATDLHLPTFPPLLSHEDLIFTSASEAMAQGTKGPSKAIKDLTFAQAAAAADNPAPSAATPSSRQSVPPSSSQTAPLSERESPLTELADDEAHFDSGSDDGVPTEKIPCPTGLTRKTLAKHNAWDEHGETTRKITVFVHQLADKYLNIEEVFSNQDRAAVKDVCCRAKERYPVLKRYAKNWPTRCILQAHLKITKNAAQAAVVSRLCTITANRRKKVPRLVVFLNIWASLY
ncbi:hypothetical protein FB451DRAFT_1401181 [Mycena latifolia]|nr:hypothetical protein FB451DRAFT_1401181 [Mycena latifolia]